MRYQMHIFIYANYIGNIINMKAGLLKEIINIYKPIVTKSETGAQKLTYELFYVTKSHVMHNSGSRETESGEIFYSISKTFIVRNYIPVNEHMIIEYCSKKFKIISIIPNKYYGDLEIYTEAINE